MDTSKLLLIKAILTVSLGLAARVTLAQVQITGTVYDKSLQFAMRGVSVMSASGAGTVTDSLGHYQIKLPSNDSLFFSYLGRATQKFAVKEIPVGYPFDMSLEVAVDSLPAAFVRSGNYQLDSLDNRKEYKNIFDYSPNYFTGANTGRNGGGFGIGLDIDMFFSGAKTRRMEAFQQRLKDDEQDKYVDHRFTKAVVRRVTGLQSPALDTFMRQYRPSYDFILSCESEYQFYKYILEWAQFFKKDWNATHPSTSPAEQED